MSLRRLGGRSSRTMILNRLPGFRESVSYAATIDVLSVLENTPFLEPTPTRLPYTSRRAPRTVPAPERAPRDGSP